MYPAERLDFFANFPNSDQQDKQDVIHKNASVSGSLSKKLANSFYLNN